MIDTLVMWAMASLTVASLKTAGFRSSTDSRHRHQRHGHAPRLMRDLRTTIAMITIMPITAAPTATTLKAIACETDSEFPRSGR